MVTGSIGAEAAAAEMVRISADFAEQIIVARDAASLAATVTRGALAECRADLAVLLDGGAGRPSALASAARAPGDAASDRLLAALFEAARRDLVPLAVGRQGEAGLPYLRRLLREETFSAAVVAPLAEGGRATGALALLWRGQRALDLPGLREHAATLARLVGLRLADVRAAAAVGREVLWLDSLAENAADALLVVDAETMAVVRANRMAEEMSGYAGGSLIGRPLGDLVAIGREDMAALRGLRGRRLVDGRLVQRAGTALPVAIAASAIADASPPVLMLCLRDLNELWQPLQRIMLAERLAGMSRLTAVIAHEINNPLQAIANALQLLGRPLEEEKRARYLSLAQAEVDRLASLIRRALDVYQPTREGWRAVAVQPLLESVCAQLQPVAAAQLVEVACEFGAPGVYVSGIGSHIREVFLGLAGNALEAMRSGGRLLIGTRLEGGAAGRDQVVVVEVSDTGPQLGEEQLQHMFEPFAPGGRGDGMGLAICYSIVELHAGRLAVASGESGTTFSVRLPVASQYD